MLSNSPVPLNTSTLNKMSDPKDINEYFQTAKELTLKAGEVNTQKKRKRNYVIWISVHNNVNYN